MRLVVDVETDGIDNPSVIHCIIARDIDAEEDYTFVRGEVHRHFPHFLKRCTAFVGHNCISFDIPILRRLVGVSVDPSIVTDTLVYSRLLEFTLPGGHSLEAWGRRLGIAKEGLDITDWSSFTPEMLERCLSDAKINVELFKHLEYKAKTDYHNKFEKALAVEHQIAFICQEMHEEGFGFDIQKATDLYQEIFQKVEEIDSGLATAFPPKIKREQLKTKIKETVIPFNPASPAQIVERLEEHWKPTEKTDSGKSWKVSEKNLATLSDEAPEAAQRLVERLLLASRLRTLEQWFKAYNDRTERIHATFSGLGTWTHRMGHREPNLANVAAPKSIKYHGKLLAELATSYGGRMRELWRVGPEDDEWLIGTDAEGIQLRIFGHYIDDQGFIQALVSGTKDNGTDPHSLNARILGCSRETAKTFIYAFLLGAGDRKIAEILAVSPRAGRSAKRDYIKAIPGLERLKQETIPRDAQRGYIEGFDGRLVKVESEHKVMAAYLQVGEAVIMKHANVLWRKQAGDEGFWFRQVNFVHDEWQTKSKGSEETAHRLGRIQANSIQLIGERFQLRCPMAGEYTIGKNWRDTH